jgi:hypothetical protein
VHWELKAYIKSMRMPIRSDPLNNALVVRYQMALAFEIAFVDTFPLFERAIKMRKDFGSAAFLAGHNDEYDFVSAQFFVGEAVDADLRCAHGECPWEKATIRDTLASPMVVQAPNYANSFCSVTMGKGAISALRVCLCSRLRVRRWRAEFPASSPE